MILKIHGHIGDNAAALIDAQLTPAESERAWQHVLACPGCRRLVEHEAWTKRQLSSLCSGLMSGAHGPFDPEAADSSENAVSEKASSEGVRRRCDQPTDELKGALYSVHTWAERVGCPVAAQRSSSTHTARLGAIAAVTASSAVGAAVVGLFAVSSTPVGRGEAPRNPATLSIATGMLAARQSSAPPQSVTANRDGLPLAWPSRSTLLVR